MGRMVSIVAIMLVGGCSSEQSITPEVETLKSKGGVYAVERVPGVNPDQLPQNSDLKMADQNLVKYAETVCSLDVKPEYAPSRCDIYVQPDKAGTLIGYAIVTQNNKEGARFQTVTALNERKESGDCWLDGKLAGADSNYNRPVADISQNFDARSMYAAWEKEPGNFLVTEPSPETDEDPNYAMGVWYVEKKGDKLRISQERWNYCYRDKDVSIDDVFYRLLGLKRMS